MESVQHAYSAMSDQYIELFGSISQVHPDDLALIVRHLSIRPGLVLDVGCGPGHHTAHLRSRGVDVTGLDLVPKFIAHARATYPGGRYELGSMHELPVSDGSVVGILAWYSLIHMPPDGIDHALTELHRVLAPGGTLVVGWFDGDEVTAFDHKVTTAYYWPIGELSRRLRRVGFVEVERQQRAAVAETGQRAHAAVVAVAAASK